MQYRTLGRLGWSVSEMGFGAWAIGGSWGRQDDSESVRALHAAIDLGVNFIDTAQGYGKGHSERLIGQVLQDRRETVFVATKIPPVPDSTTWPPPDDADSRKMYPASYIIRECEKSLRRLKRDALDIYQFHTWSAGFNIQDEWYEAMSALRTQGKIRAIGASVPDTKPDSVIGALAQGRVDTVQVIYNLFEQYPQCNLFPVCERLGSGVIVRVPFDEGALTGKFTRSTKFPRGDIRRHYFRGKNLPAVVERVERIRGFKEGRHPQMSMAEYALRFSLSHSAVSVVIPGMRSVQQVEWNTAAADGRRLEAEELSGLRQFSWRKDFWFEEVAT